MKKLLVPFAVGIAIGLGASSAAVAFLGRSAPSLTDSLSAAIGPEAADSAAADGAHGEAADSVAAAAGGAAADSSGAPSAAGPVFVADTIPVGATVDPTAGSSLALAGGGMPAAATELDTTRLAQLFGSMQAREAAAVMEHMDDFEVQVILGQLGNRAAAAILSNLSPERAAVISRTVIRGERSSP